ncbi:hypothetical protein JCM9279_000587 [Rhodotorula babjevae]
MSAAADESCVICEEPGRMRCGACRLVKFCSTSCQRILWPVHKTLCGRDPDVFYFPPLTPSEVDRLEKVKHKRVTVSEPPFIDCVRFCGYTWDCLLALISLAEPSADGVDVTTTRNHFIMLARYHLFHAEMPWHQGIGAGASWDMLAGAMFHFVEYWRQEHLERKGDGSAVLDDRVWRVFNKLLRLELARAALEEFYDSATDPKSRRTWLRLEVLALERGLAEIERANLSPLTRDHVHTSSSR